MRWTPFFRPAEALNRLWNEGAIKFYGLDLDGSISDFSALERVNREQLAIKRAEFFQPDAQSLERAGRNYPGVIEVKFFRLIHGQYREWIQFQFRDPKLWICQFFC